MASNTKVKNFTKTQLSKMCLMWHKNDTPPITDVQWTAYLMSIQTNTLSKREFPNVDDIHSLQLNRHFYWLVRLAIINNNQNALNQAFVFYVKLRKARSNYKNEIKNLSVKKVSDLKNRVSSGN